MSSSIVRLKTAFFEVPNSIVSRLKRVSAILAKLSSDVNIPEASIQSLWPILKDSIIISTVSPGSSTPLLFPEPLSSIVRVPISRTGAFIVISNSEFHVLFPSAINWKFTSYWSGTKFETENSKPSVTEARPPARIFP